MPAKTNRASGKPVPANVQAAALEKQKLEDAAAEPAPPVDVKPVAETLVADNIELHLVARKPRGKSLTIKITPEY